MKVGIVAGEKSGDYLGSELIRAIRKDYPQAEFVGLCGPLMQAQGARSLAQMDKISIMGLAGLFSALREILAIRNRIFQYFKNSPPDVFIGIDVPDFNLRLERKLKLLGIPTVHLVSPTVWAWRGGRIKKIRRSIDLMLTLFPFEEQFYHEHGVPVKYVGHPLARQILNWQAPPGFRESFATAGQTLIAVMPGSRMSEVSRLAPAMIEAASKLHNTRPELRFVIPFASDEIKQFLLDDFKLDTTLFNLIDGQSRDLLKVADLVILASGTAALEAALFAKPMVVMYRMDRLSVVLFRHTVRVEHFSMPNHLTSPPVVPELIQEQATAERLFDAVEKLLDDPVYFESMRAALAGIAPALDADSGKLASDAIMQLLASRTAPA